MSVLLFLSLAHAGPTPDHVREGLLDAHNVRRGQVARGDFMPVVPSASNMNRLFWDDALAEAAQEWVNQCQFGHDPNRSTQVTRFANLASFDLPSNLFVGSAIYATSVTDLTDLATDSTDAWFNEIQNYTYGPHVADPASAHFSQLVWADTRYVGCAVADCTNSGSLFRTHLVCNYFPAGNWVGQPAYEQGTASAATCDADREHIQDGLCSGCMDPTFHSTGGQSSSTTCTPRPGSCASAADCDGFDTCTDDGAFFDYSCVSNRCELRTEVCATGSCALGTCTVPPSQGATVLDFEDLFCQSGDVPSVTDVTGDARRYAAEGYHVRDHGGTGRPVGLARRCASDPFYPGSSALVGLTPDGLTSLSRVDGEPFDALELTLDGGTGRTLTLFAVDDAGDFHRAILTTDGRVGQETFELGPEFSHLRHMWWVYEDAFLSIDNITLSHEPAPTLSLTGAATCPGGGAGALIWSGATPNERIILLSATDLGSETYDTGACAGTVTGLGSTDFGTLARGTTGVDGDGVLAGQAPARLCGTYVQALDPVTCELSEIVVLD